MRPCEKCGVDVIDKRQAHSEAPLVLDAKPSPVGDWILLEGDLADRPRKVRKHAAHRLHLYTCPVNALDVARALKGV